MIAQRLLPVGTPRHERVFNLVKTIDGLDDLNPLAWFALWSLFTAGISSYDGYVNRYIFWDFSRWLPGILGLAFWTVMYVMVLRPRKWMEFSPQSAITKKLVIHLALAEVIFLSGWAHISLQGFFISLSYLLGYGAILLVYTIPIENMESGGKVIPDSSYRFRIVITGVLLLVLAMGSGIYRDDPVLSTAAVVSLPFYIVALFDNHVRHVQRLRFYPAFIFTGFIASREAWYFMAAVLLFYFLRHFYYFRLGIIHPSFGVDHDELNFETE